MTEPPRPTPTGPAPTATDLLAADREALRASLVDEQRACQAQIAELTRNFDEIVAAVELTNNDDEHDPEGTTIAFERAQAVALLNQAKADLEAIHLALRRFEDGTYGVCEDCDQAIGIERLSAIPAASKCVACA